MHSNEPQNGFDLTMSKADAADSDSTLRKHRQRGLIPWKPGQFGNPKGRPQGSRNKLTEDFFRDLCDAWQAFGKPALVTAIARGLQSGLDPAAPDQDAQIIQ